MVERETVLILGAGASADYGYPTGDNFRQEVMNFGTKERHLTWLHQAKVSDKDMNEFKDRFSSSGTETVDEFLEHNRSIRSTGKKVIAGVLIEHEELRGHHAIGGWYAYLMQRLRENVRDGIEQLKNNKLTVITFNYDRSLEAFLASAIENSFEGATRAQIRDVLESLGFYHVHGSLGKLEWQVDEGETEYRPYTREIREGAELEKAANGIILPYEEGFAEVGEKAREAIRNAERIVIMGFGYARDNMNKLQLPTRKTDAHFKSDRLIIGTANRIPDYRRETLERQNPALNLERQDWNLREFLDQSRHLRGLE